MDTQRSRLEVRDLSVAVGSRELLHQVRLDVEAGERIGLVGESGSGKSLTCRALTGTLGRVRAKITGGAVELDGRPLHTLGERAWQRLRGRVIGLVPQASLSSLDPVRSIGRQLEETVRYHEPGCDSHARALELLDKVALPSAGQLLSRFPHELSGGMRQRVVIALAIAGRPRFLLADEPTTALDVTVQKDILILMRALCDEDGMALVLVTHDLAVVRAIAQRVFIMKDGETVESGETEALFTAATHPYTQMLLTSRVGASSRPPANRAAQASADPGAGARQVERSVELS